MEVSFCKGERIFTSNSSLVLYALHVFRKKLQKIPCYICSLSFAKWKYSWVKIASYGMYMLLCPAKHILQSFGLQLSSDLDLVPFMVLILACSVRHMCVMLRQEVPFLLWNHWPFLLVCLTFIVWQNPNACAWYMACNWRSLKLCGEHCLETYRDQMLWTRGDQMGSCCWISDSFIVGFVFMGNLQHLLSSLCSNTVKSQSAPNYEVEKKLPLNLLLSLQFLNSNEIERTLGVS